MEAVDAIARRYGVRPSEILAETDPFRAFSIDLWAHNWGAQRDQRLEWQARRKG